MADTVRAVEIGSILPRTESSRRRLPSRRILLGVAALLVLAGVIVLSPLIGTVLNLVVDTGTSGRGQGVTGLADLVLLVKAIVALALVGVAVGVVARSTEQATDGGPVIPDHVDLLDLSQPNVQQAGAHLAGRHEGCHRPRGLAAGEIVLAQITEDAAASLVDIPHECRTRRRQSGLYPLLVGVPNADEDIVEEVSAAYETTLLVDANDPEVRERLPTFLGLVAHLCKSSYREEAPHLGAVSLNCIDVAASEPTDPDLQDEIRVGFGEPLASEVDDADRVDEWPPAVTIVSAPPDYLETAIDSLPPQDETLIPVQTPHHDTIHITRLFDAAEAADMDTQWEVRQAVIQEGLTGSPP